MNTRIVRFGPKGLNAAREFLSYIRRGAVTRDGEPGVLYSAREDIADGSGFLKRCAQDRHHFRLVVTAEDGAEYDALKPLIRRFMTRLEQDLGTRLEWVAGDHLNTERPHTHILLRGKDELAEDLVISPRYINLGMRERLRGVVSIDLGPKADTKIEQRLRLEVHAERLTSIDRALLAGMDSAGTVQSVRRGMVDHSIRAGRLRKLQSLGLAEELGQGGWRLSQDLEPVLRALEDRDVIMGRMRRVLLSASLQRAPSEQLVFVPQAGTSVTGRLVGKGPADGVSNDAYLVVDGIDGRAHYVTTRGTPNTHGLAVGAIVRVAPHVQSDGARAEVEILSAVPLERLPDCDGPTWLDRTLIRPQVQPRDAGFGRELRSALAARRLWLIEQGLAFGNAAEVRCCPGMIDLLQRRELSRLVDSISRDSGLEFVQAADGRHLKGVVRRRIDLASGSFAMVADGRLYSLVPWQPDLENAIGREVIGVAGGGGISWSFSKDRGIEI